MSNFKLNINKIDFELKNLFENVNIEEKSEKANFFIEIRANKMFLFEACKKRVEVKVKINKFDLNSNYINWSYLVNPLDESFGKIDRVSMIGNISNDIFDIASKKRMVNEYFNSLEPQYDMINENLEINSNNIEKIIKKYTNIVDFISDKIQINYNTEGITMANKFRLESELLKENIAYVSFDGDKIKIKF